MHIVRRDARLVEAETAMTLPTASDRHNATAVHGSDRRRVLRLALAMGLATFAPPVRADFAPKNLRFLIGNGPGGQTDKLFRLFMGHAQRAMPGTSVSIENEDRGSGLLAAKMLYEASGNAEIAGSASSSLIYSWLLGQEGVAFEFERFSVVVNLNRPPRVLVATAQSGIKSFADLLARDKATTVPAGSAVSSAFLEPLLINAMTGARLNPVPGYQGGARNLALLSGETELGLGTLESLLPVVETPGSTIILRLNSEPLPAPYADVPDLASFAKSADAPRIIALMAACADIGGLMVMPPDIAPETLAQARALFLKVAQSSEFQEEAAKQGFMIDIIPGDVAAARLANIFGRSADMKGLLKSALECGRQRAAGAAACS
jgi:tripartite-type tricarboxylate transporter receptor subunit TctC